MSQELTGESAGYDGSIEGELGRSSRGSWPPKERQSGSTPLQARGGKRCGGSRRHSGMTC